MASLRRDSLTLLNLAWPVVINRAGILTLSITDTVMVGRYAAEHLAYAGIGMVPSNIYILILIGLLMGTPVLVSNNFGAGKLKQAEGYMVASPPLGVCAGRAGFCFLRLWRAVFIADRANAGNGRKGRADFLYCRSQPALGSDSYDHRLFP